MTASPKANGFYKAGLFKKFIPGLYRLNAIDILKKQKNNNISIHEYENGDWTYHAKGAWFYEADEPAGPVATIIGSSNLSKRSNRRDTEVQLYMIAECDEFKARLHSEQEHLFSSAKTVDIPTLKRDEQYKLSWKDRIIKKIFNPML